VRLARRRYGDAVREALIVVWEASDRVCSKRLRPLVPVLLPALERHGRLVIEADVRRLLLEISPASMDRLLSEVRLVASGGRRRRAGFSSAVRRAVPVRTFGDWNDPPGFVEVDFVAHAGTSAAGSFVQTMVLTDIATGWTECVPVVVRTGALVIEALIAARTLFPFPLRGVDFDNDGAFMNEAVVDWCRNQGLEVTRSRAYRKNDQAWVEQKNGAIVRRLVGYGRLEGLASAQALARLYAASRLHTNLFQPSFKLKEKKRIGAGAQALSPAAAADGPRPCPCRGRRGEQDAAARAPRAGRSGAPARRGVRGSGRAGRARRSARDAGGAARADHRRSRPVCRQPEDGVARG
jgi:hypothetical protein